MKPAPFDYVRPDTLADACRILADDDDAMILAGGQTLIPMLSMRLARPSRLVDISRIEGLTGIEVQAGEVKIGAMTRQAAIACSPAITEHVPLLAAVMPWVGHAPTRARGTIGGSIANADPSAEIPLALVVLDGQIDLAHTGGTRTVSARKFCIGPMTTTIEPGECLIGARFPVWTEGHIGIGFHEVANRRRDIALVSSAAQVALDDAGKCTRCAVGIGGVTETPLALADASQALIGTRLVDADIVAFVRSAVVDLPALSDAHASAGYRKRAAAKLIKDALCDARDNALAMHGAA